MARLFVIGGAATDIIGHPFKPLIAEDSNPGQIHIGFGGVGRNIAENAVRLKSPVVFHSGFGDDILGKLNYQNCSDLGIDMRFSQWVKGARSAKYMAILNHQGDMHSAIADVSILDQLSIEDYQAVIDDMCEDDICVLDANLNQDILIRLVEKIPCRIAFEPISTTKALKAQPLFPRIDILKPNRLEAQALLGYELNSYARIHQALSDFLDLGVKEILISDGELGVYVAYQQTRLHLKHPVAQSTNATGAGDAFFGAYLGLRLKGHSIEEACELAMIAARLTIQCEDTVNPNLSLEALLDEQTHLSLSVQDLTDEI